MKKSIFYTQQIYKMLAFIIEKPLQGGKYNM